MGCDDRLGGAKRCPDGGGTDYRQRVANLKQNPQARAHLVQSLGFDVVDVRVRFAPPVVPGLGWLAADPLRAHSHYMNSRQVQQAVICGVDAGRIRQGADGCSVQGVDAGVW